MARSSTKTTQSELQEDLAATITENLNHLFKDGKVAYLGIEEETPTDLTDFLSTGSSLLDVAISNRLNGGIAFGRITELTGLEGSGKSLVAAHMMANVQKQGGVAVLIDTETAVNWDFFEAVGIDRSKLVYSHLDTIEDIFQAIEKIIESVRSSNKDTQVIIVVDSIAGASTKDEKEGKYEKEGYGMMKAYLVSKAMRKITSTIARQKIALVLTNQLRQKVGFSAPGADPWTTSGGKAIAFHSSVRLRFSSIEKIKRSSDSKEVIGVKIKADVKKNRLGPPHRTVVFDIYFDRGIDDFGSWLSYLREKGIIEGSRSNNLTYKMDSGKEFKFGEKSWHETLASNDELRKELYIKLCNTLIMSYRSDGLAPEELHRESVEDDE